MTITAISVEDESKSASVTVKVPVAAESIHLALSAQTLYLGGNGSNTATLTVTFTPAGTENKTLTLSGENDIVRLSRTEENDTNGKVTYKVEALKEGAATLRAVAEDGGRSGTIDVTVVGAVTGLTLTSNNLTEKDGKKLLVIPEAGTVATVSYQVTPASGDQSVTVACAPEGVVEVVSAGEGSITLRALKLGTADLTVASKTGGADAKAEFQVQVTVAVRGVSLSSEALEFTRNDSASQTLTLALDPVETDDKEITVTLAGEEGVIALPGGSNSNPITGSAVLTADENGRAVLTVRATRKAGTATITAKAKNGEAKTCTVTVKPLALTELTLTAPNSAYTLDNDTAAALDWAPNAGLDKTEDLLTAAWSVISGSGDVLTVDSSTGEMTLLGAGSATVELKVTQGITNKVIAKSCQVNVAALLPEHIYVSLPEGWSKGAGTAEDPIVLDKDGTVQLTAEISPEKTTDKGVSWSSGNATVVRVDSSGLVTALKLDENAYPITVKANQKDKDDKELFATVYVKVPFRPTGVTVAANANVTGWDSASLTLDWNGTDTVTLNGEGGLLKAVVTPEKAENRNVTWSFVSADSSMLEERGGVLTVKGTGTATVNATTEDGNLSSNSVTVTVRPRATGITPASQNVTLGMSGDSSTRELAFSVQPQGADQTVTPTVTSGADVVKAETVAGKAGTILLTALKTGTATVRVQGPNNLTATVNVSVTRSANDITLSESSLELALGGTAELTTALDPEDSTDALTWSSTDPSVVTVAADASDSRKATVTASGTKEGTAQIAVTNGSITKYCAVTVPIQVRSVTLSGDALNGGELAVTRDQTVTVKAAVTPAEAGHKTLTVTAADGTVAQVLNGTVTADADTGEAEIQIKGLKAGESTALTVTPGEGQAAACTVKVNPVKLTGVTLSETRLTMDTAVNTEKTLTASFNDGVDAEKDLVSLEWTVDDGEIVSVENGVVTAKKAGSTLIRLVAKQNGTALPEVICTVTVSAPEPRSVEIRNGETLVNGGTITLDLNAEKNGTSKTVTLSAAVLPEGAEQGVTWESNRPETGASVSDGVVTALGPGDTVITARSTKDTSKKAQLTISVPVAIQSVSMDQNELKLHILNTQIGDLALNIVTVNGEAAANQNVTWTSDNETVARVEGRSPTAMVTAVAPGVAEIKAVTEDGKLEATCRVIVQSPVTSVTVKDSDGTALGSTSTVTFASIGDTAAITASVNSLAGVTDAEAKANPALNCVSADPGIVFVTQGKTGVDGVTPITLKAEGNGSTTVTVTSAEDSTKSVTFNVSVTVPVTELTLSSSDGGSGSSSLDKTKTLTLTAATNPDARDQEITWSVDQSDLVTLSGTEGASITVTAVKYGDAVITAASKKYPEVTASYTVSVNPTLPQQITVTASGEFDLNYENKNKVTLTAAVTPADADFKDVTWTVTDPDGLVTNTESGNTCVLTRNITAGSVTVQAQVLRDSEALCSSETVTVTIPAGVESVELDQTGTKSLITNVDDSKTLQLTATATVGGEAGQSIPAGELTWSCNPSGVVTVVNGLVTAAGNGTATVTASYKGVTSAALTVKVTTQVEGVSISPRDITLDPDETLQLTATLSPSAPNAPSNTAVSWDSVDQDVVTVSSTGLLTAQPVTGDAERTSKLTVTTADQGKTDEITVTVRPKVESVTVQKDDSDVTDQLILDTGGTLNLSAAVLPQKANQTVKWSVSSGDAATVNENTGEVKAGNTAGTVTITATSASKQSGTPVSASVTVVVRQQIESVALNQTADKELELGGSLELSAILTPTTATVSDWEWTVTGDTGAVTLTKLDGGKNARVLASNDTAGVVYVSVTAQTVDKTETSALLKITVKDAPGEVTVSPASYELGYGLTTQLSASVSSAGGNATQSFSWSSNNQNVATVNASGLVTAKGVGTATITAASKVDSTKKASCTITVVKYISSVALSESSITMNVSETRTLTATLSPVDPTNPAYTLIGGTSSEPYAKPVWESSNAAVANVDSNGKITAVGEGTATITVKVTNGSGLNEVTKQATCTVTVGAEVTAEAFTVTSDVEGDPNLLPLKRNGTLTLIAYVEGLTGYTVSWSIKNNSSAVQLSATTGTSVTVTGKSAGDAEVIATVGGKTVSRSISVSDVLVESISLNASSWNFGTDTTTTKTLIATVAPANATSVDLVWSIKEGSTNYVGPAKAEANVGQVVTIPANSKGSYVVVTPVGNGTATVMVTDTKSGQTAECQITVDIKVTSVSLANVTLAKDESKTLTLNFTPKWAKNQTVTSWVSADLGIVFVDSSGTVLGMKTGSTEITATTQDGSKTATCTVTVSATPVTGLQLNHSSYTLQEKNNTVTLQATVEPSDATDQTVSWSVSGGTDVVRLDVSKDTASAVVTALAKGTATVKASIGGYEKECEIKVEPRVKGVSIIGEPNRSMQVTDTLTLTPVLNPTDAQNTGLTWSSTDPAVASVNDGLVSALSTGTATITVRTVDGGFTAQCEITVTELPPTSLEIWYAGEAVSSLTLERVGAAKQLSAKLTPEESAGTVRWESENSDIAAVDQNGLVTAVAPGNTNIIARVGTAVYSTVTVTVKAPAESIELDQTAVAVEKGGSVTLTASVEPGNSTDTVRWTTISNKFSINPTEGNTVTVTVLGTAEAGQGTITATAGTKSAECVISVIDPAHPFSSLSVSNAPKLRAEVQGEQIVVSGSVPAGTAKPAAEELAGRLLITPVQGLSCSVSGDQVTVTFAGSGSTKVYTVNADSVSVELANATVTAQVVGGDGVTVNSPELADAIQSAAYDQLAAKIQSESVSDTAEVTVDLAVNISKASTTETVDGEQVSIDILDITPTYNISTGGVTLTADVADSGYRQFRAEADPAHAPGNERSGGDGFGTGTVRGGRAAGRNLARHMAAEKIQHCGAVFPDSGGLPVLPESGRRNGALPLR